MNNRKLNYFHCPGLTILGFPHPGLKDPSSTRMNISHHALNVDGLVNGKQSINPYKSRASRK